jgi:CheY-like chemotaxis protein
MLRPTVLIVDDDEDIRESLGQLLEGEGYAVVSAENGQVALDQLRTMKRPQLVLLDLMMPVMNGWDFITAMRANDAFTEVPIVVVSAGRSKRPDGVRAYIEKPLNLSALLSLLEEIDSNRNARVN